MMGYFTKFVFVVFIFSMLNSYAIAYPTQSSDMTRPSTNSRFSNAYMLANGQYWVFATGGVTTLFGMTPVYPRCPTSMYPTVSVAFAGTRSDTGSGPFIGQVPMQYSFIADTAQGYLIQVQNFYWQQQYAAGWIKVTWTIYCNNP